MLRRRYLKTVRVGRAKPGRQGPPQPRGLVLSDAQVGETGMGKGSGVQSRRRMSLAPLTLTFSHPCLPCSAEPFSFSSPSRTLC
jgi:hypothetical protein